ncbi:ionotropic receptor 25a-like [Athalia rosae]|uniref:ionotropic receptor 25a-like n=1 Tax=Athalia rosae TaxID=37344 RepID=UPI002033AA95|nr:ionotropic receptor 25a-like [Athalia rosae]
MMRRLSMALLLYLTFIAYHFRSVHANEANDSRFDMGPNSKSSRPLNLLVINDEKNDSANKSVANALEELKEQRRDLFIGDISVVQINGSDPQGTLISICGVWDTAVRQNSNKIPDLILDTTMIGPGSRTVNSFAAAMGLPTLSAQFGHGNGLGKWKNFKANQANYLIQVMPPADLVPEAIRQLVITMNVSNAAILFDDNFVMDHKYKSLLQKVPVRHVIVKAKEAGSQMTKQLSKLRNLDIVNFFVLGGPETLRAALDAAQALNFTGRKFAWHGLTLGDFSPDCDCMNITVLFLKPSPSANQQALGELKNKGLLMKPVLTSAFYYDLTRIGVTAMRAAIDSGHWPADSNHLTCDAYDGNNTPVRSIPFLSHLKNVTSSSEFQPIYANFTWGERNGQHHASFQMTMSMVIIANSNPVSTEKVGLWDAGIDRQLEVISEDLIANHTAQTIYKVVTVVQAPFVMYDAETNTWSGYCIDLLEEIRSIVKFEYEIREMKNGRYGFMDDDGNWSGMIKELKEKRADIGLGSIFITAERETAVDFTIPYHELVGHSILMKKPDSQTSSLKFLTVLEYNVWFCILAAYFFTSFLMWVFDRWSPYSYQNNREKYKDDEEKREFNLKECLWFCMTSLTPQGGGEAPKNLSGRLVAVAWWLFGFIIIASYTANLAAFLTVSRLETSIESLDDLSNQYKIQFAPLNNSYAHRYFARMAGIERRFYEIWKDMSLNNNFSEVEKSKLVVWDHPISDKYIKLYQTMIEAGMPETMDEAVARVRASESFGEGFAYIGEATSVRYLVMTNCDLISVGKEFSRKSYGIALQKGSPLKTKFDKALTVLYTKLTMTKLSAKWWQENPARKICPKQPDQNAGIGIDDVGGVFMIIFLGTCIAFLVVAFEYLWHRYRPRNISKVKNSRNPGTTLTISLRPAKLHFQPAAVPPEDVFAPREHRGKM